MKTLSLHLKIVKGIHPLFDPASTARSPLGTEDGIPIQLIEPFCKPCTPAPLDIMTQRNAKYSIDFPSALAICTSDPVPDVKRILAPRDA